MTRRRTETAEQSNRPYLRRTLFVCVVVCLAFLCLLVWLFRMMVLQHDQYESEAIDNQTSSIPVIANRGTIYDCNMNVLADTISLERAYLDPVAIQRKEIDVDTLARELGELLDADEKVIRKRAKRVERNYEIIKRKIPREMAAALREYIDENHLTDCIYLEPDSKRVYPHSDLAAQLLGFVNEENKGADGLEAEYEEALRGVSGATVRTRGNNGVEMLFSFEKLYEPEDGESLVLTLDSTAQYYLEKNMKAAVEKYDVQNGAFGIVMDVTTGEVKAMATLGSYDPNNFMEIADETTRKALNTIEEKLEAAKKAAGITEDSEEESEKSSKNNAKITLYESILKEYNDKVYQARLAQWRNRAVSDGYEPGSTFKTITLAAALEEGAVSLEDTWYCGGAAQIEKRHDLLHCWKDEGHGSQTTAQALQNSCNLAFANIGIKLGGEKLYQYVKDFGLMEKTGIDLPGEASGIFFSKETIADPDSYASLTSAAFGQTFKVTPIQLVRAISAVVNGGYLMEPYVVSEIVDAEGNVTEKREPTVLRQVISEETSKTMCKLMESVVTEGTASNAKVAGYPIGGKTGTSEKIDVFDEDGNPVQDKIVSFVGVAPMDEPKYLVLVALDTPSTATGYYISGGVMAAPVVGNVFSDILPYFGIAANYSEEDLPYARMTMPNVSGLSKEEAQKAVEEQHLNVKFIGSGTKVTDQIPMGGSEVPGSSTVLLYLGEKKPTDRVTVPDLMGMSEYEAMIAIQNTGGLYFLPKGTDNGYGAVSSQSIPAGKKVERGTTISVELTDFTALD